MNSKTITKKDQSRPLLSIMVPVYNEEASILQILKKVTALPINKYEVLVINDASKDGSLAIIKKFKDSFRSSKVMLELVTHPKNRGKGAAIKTALQMAKGDYFVVQDADLEYEPDDIPTLLKTALKNNSDAVYGSRFLGSVKNMPKPNYYANKFYNFLLRRLYKTNITDMHTCHKMVRTSFLKELDLKSNGFDYATELVSKMLRRKVTINEVPISFNGRTRREGKKINMMDGIECAYKLIIFRFSTNEILFREGSITFSRFLIVGFTGFMTNYFVLVLLTHLAGLKYITSEILAVAVALQVTFLLHDRWTYQIHTPPGTARLNFPERYVTYLMSNSFGAFMSIVTFGFLYTHLTLFMALVISALAGLMWNYLINTYFVWSRKSI